MLVFHSPDATELYILSDTIKVVKPIADNHKAHIVPGVHTIIYVGVRSTGFPVTERIDDVLRMIRGCDQAH